MRSGLGPFCYVHSEFSRLKLALARCFTCLFIVNVNAQLNFEARNGNDVWNVLITHIRPAPFTRKEKSEVLQIILSDAGVNFSFSLSEKRFSHPLLGGTLAKSPSAFWQMYEPGYTKEEGK